MRWFKKAPKPDVQAELRYVAATAAAAEVQHEKAVTLSVQVEGQAARLTIKNARNHYSEGLTLAFTGRGKPC